MQGRGGGWENLKIDATFLDFGDTFLKPDFGAVERWKRMVWKVQ